VYTAKHMKWWGWGDEGVGFDARAHPGLWPFAKAVLDVENDEVAAPHVPLEAVSLRDAIRHDGFLADLRGSVRADQICDSRRERVIHAYGKGFRDLFRMRRGMAENAPDLVLYPESEHDVLMTLRAAARHDVVVIPFGGGSNIAGCLERSERRRMAVSLDMRRIRRVLEVDTESFTARIEAGAFGPDLE
jgi:alkyldihydroxyacetonephosphate synthase